MFSFNINDTPVTIQSSHIIRKKNIQPEVVVKIHFPLSIPKLCDKKVNFLLPYEPVFSVSYTTS